MNSVSTIYAALQVFAAILVFVASYLALVVCAILFLVAAEMFSEHASLVQEYGVESVPLGTRVNSEICTQPRKPGAQLLAGRVSDVSKGAARLLPLALVRQRRF